MLEIKDIVKNYGYFNAADHVSINIEKGCIYGLAGVHGAGKTTIMKMAAGVLLPDSGSIQLNGVSITKAPGAIKRKIGYMPEHYGFYDDLTVEEHMAFYCGIHRIVKDEQPEIIGRLLELAELTGEKGARVGSLSKGRKKWLCLASCLIHNPELLILDEPACGFEPNEWDEINEILRTLCNMGKSMLVSSRDFTSLIRLCDSIGIIEHGKIVVSGTFDEIANNTNMSHINRMF